MDLFYSFPSKIMDYLLVLKTPVIDLYLILHLMLGFEFNSLFSFCLTASSSTFGLTLVVVLLSRDCYYLKNILSSFCSGKVKPSCAMSLWCWREAMKTGFFAIRSIQQMLRSLHPLEAKLKRCLSHVCMWKFFFNCFNSE